MKNSPYLNIFVGLFTASIGLTFSSAHAANCGRVLAQKGLVQIVLKKTKPRPILANDSLCDSTIETKDDGAISLQLERGKVILGANSQLAVESEKKGDEISVVNLIAGRVRTLIYKQEPTPDKVRFRIKTQTAVVGVRGTDFFVSYDPKTGATGEATLAGEVEVAKADSSEFTVIKAGQEATLANAAATFNVAALSDNTKNEIRQVSVIAHEDSDFNADNNTKWAQEAEAQASPSAAPSVAPSMAHKTCSYNCPTVGFSLLDPVGSSTDGLLNTGYELDLSVRPVFLSHLDSLLFNNFTENNRLNFNTGLYYVHFTGPDLNRQYTAVGLALGLIQHLAFSTNSRHQMINQFDLRLGDASASRDGDSSSSVNFQLRLLAGYGYQFSKVELAAQGEYLFVADSTPINAVGGRVSLGYLF